MNTRVNPPRLDDLTDPDDPSPHNLDEGQDESKALIAIGKEFRDKLNALAYRLFHVGKRCDHGPTGREIQPRQETILEALWEVANRHPDELQVAIMRRTALRAVYADERGAAVKAARTRPR